MATAPPLLRSARPSVRSGRVRVAGAPRVPFGAAVVSLFSGAGGLDLGFEQAGFETLVCVEHDRHCRRTLAANRPQWRLIEGDDPTNPGDVRRVRPEAILTTIGRRRGEVDVVIGGPPCQSFSNLGRKLGAQDPANGDLFVHYARLIDGLLPRAFVFENVEGLTQTRHDDVRAHLHSRFRALGYRLAEGMLVAADYGDPQLRRRFVIVGMQGVDDVGLPEPVYFADPESHASFFADHSDPLPFRPYRTLGEALSEPLPHGREDDLRMGVTDEVRARMRWIGPGENFRVLPDALRPACWRTGRHQGADTFGRLRADRPSVAVRTSAYNPSKGRYIHPTEDRGLSTLEMARLQSFPDEWRFVCDGRPTLVGIGRMIGNAVPVRLAHAIALAVRVQLREQPNAPRRCEPP
ncbi:MAG: DNA cytosine methyltransferase [Fimbriimonadaceae bacterium]|nr:DNA cytosine methyltransferase [Fimbriimonadaceae bacterium]